jgi:hypothetical protein
MAEIIVMLLIAIFGPIAAGNLVIGLAGLGVIAVAVVVIAPVVFVQWLAAVVADRLPSFGGGMR